MKSLSPVLRSPSSAAACRSEAEIPFAGLRRMHKLLGRMERRLKSKVETN